MIRNLVLFVGLITAFCLQHAKAQRVESPPQTRNDGWSVASLASEHISPEPLGEMEAAIHRGNFKKIGSVLLA
jgi:hypothetical protein